MLIDMHAHTSAISQCCRADANEILETAKAAGIDGLVISNHYQESYVGNGGPEEFAARYVEEYLHTLRLAREKGMRLFFGIEVTAKQHDNAHILLYGMDTDFILKNPDIYERSLSEMHSLVHAAGGLVIQAHPFRHNGHILDMRYLDGIEINCHPLYDATHRDEIINIAGKEGLLVTCGGDYHADTYRSICGTYLPDDAREWKDVIHHLTTAPTIRMHVHELRTDDHSDVEFVK